MLVANTLCWFCHCTAQLFYFHHVFTFTDVGEQFNGERLLDDSSIKKIGSR
jgi:hypothetical protein